MTENCSDCTFLEAGGCSRLRVNERGVLQEAKLFVDFLLTGFRPPPEFCCSLFKKRDTFYADNSTLAVWHFEEMRFSIKKRSGLLFVHIEKLDKYGNIERALTSPLPPEIRLEEGD